MDNTSRRPLLLSTPWTLALTGALVALNVGLFIESTFAASLIHGLQFDRSAILGGELWRIVTGNLVHWSTEHFLLDVGSFLVLGMFCERTLGRRYVGVLAGAALAVGASLMILAPELAIYRGLSGVVSGQFAAALAAEFGQAPADRRKWIWLLPATGIFAVKIAFECITGQMFFGTEALGDIGTPVPLAHLVGVLGAVGFLAAVWIARRASRKRPASLQVVLTRFEHPPNLNA